MNMIVAQGSPGSKVRTVQDNPLVFVQAVEAARQFIRQLPPMDDEEGKLADVVQKAYDLLPQ